MEEAKTALDSMGCKVFITKFFNFFYKHKTDKVYLLDIQYKN